MKRTFTTSLIIAAVSTLAISPMAVAAPPAGSPYATDPQNSHVFDETSQAIGKVNMITCYISSMRPDLMVNGGDYVALVNQSRCDPNSQSSTANSGSTSGGSGAPNYQAATVNSLRASNLDPMRAEVWIDQNHQGVPDTIFANLSASAPPGSANPDGTINPYGVFRMDYCDTAAGSCQSQGFLQGDPTGITYASTDQHGNNGNPSSTQLYLTKGANDSGAGAVKLADTGAPTVTYQFGYDVNFFRRSDGVNDLCFDRRLSTSQMSVWSYGLYDGQGNRVLLNSGFPITFSSGGTIYQGYAGYWGVSMPPAGLAALTTGSLVQRQNFDGSPGTPYTAVRAGGRLTSYTRQTAALSAFAKVSFTTQFFQGLTNATAAAIMPGTAGNQMGNYQLDAYWDAVAQTFQIDGYMVCSNSGCAMHSLNPVVALSSQDLTPYVGGLNGWSQSYGGPVAIPGATMAAIIGGSPAGIVYYRTQDLVYPGSANAPPSLYCVNNCPTLTAINGFLANPQTSSSPYDAGTLNQFINGANSVAYAFGGDGSLGAMDGAAVVPLNAQLGGQFQWGVQSGRMLPSLNALNCPSGGGYCESNADNAAVYYVWETGPNAWDQFVGLQSSPGVYLTFDAPLSMNFSVPNDPATYGQSAGSTLVLQYQGFGQLNGVPGQCVDPVSNAPVSCDAPNARWVPAFSIPYDAVAGVVTDSASNVYYVKWLDAEVRFSQVAGASCSGLALGGLGNLPALNGMHNPSSPADPTYIGSEPVFATPPTPKIIDGVCTSATCP